MIFLKEKGKFPVKTILIALFALLIIGSASFIYWWFEICKENEYDVPYSHITGIVIKDNEIYTSDWFEQSIYKQNLDLNISPIRSYFFVNKYISGLAYANDSVVSCDMMGHKFYNHDVKQSFEIINEVPSPSNQPSGLFYDGVFLWSCDADTKKIYKHKNDEVFTVIEEFPSPGSYPVGVYVYGKFLYSADADANCLYKHNLDKKLTVIAKYPLAKKDGRTITAFTITKKDKRIWVAYDDIGRIYSYSLYRLPLRR